VSLRTRLLVGLAVLVLAAVASSGWLVLQVAQARLKEAQDQSAQALGEELLAVLQRSMERELPADRAALADAARALVERGALLAVTIVDSARNPIVGDAEAGRDGALGGALVGATFVVRHPPSLRFYAPLRSARGVVGAARLDLPGDGRLTRALDDARALLGAVALVDGGLVLLFGVLFIRRVVGPLEALAQTAHQVAAGDLEVPPVPRTTRDDEIARLTDAFNRMTASLRGQRDQMVAQEKLATVGRLAAGVAHEVGNPLAAVIGYADLLLHDEPPGGARRDALERIRRETGRISGIVADLLDYSRPVTGAVEPVQLGATAEAAVSLVRPQARFRDVAVENRIPPSLAPAALAASRLVQVLVNLLLNAADAMDGRGTVVLDGREVGGALELTVRDSGPGVAPELAATIFDPFFTTKDPGHGTGLGLAISRSIARAYGGDLILASDGPGATFVVRLPRYAAATISEAAATISEAAATISEAASSSTGGRSTG
jgi:signal transduction histidine kinase